MEYTIREMSAKEYKLLNDFLYEAIFIPEGINPQKETLLMNRNCRSI